MENNNKKITIAHGSGGKLTYDLINGLFFDKFRNDILCEEDDAALISDISGNLAFSTDSFVVKPLFFPGGDIGKLAVCGTVNDLAVSGARPLYLSAGFIIEEGLDYSDLETIAASMADYASQAGVTIVTGDTKVVGSGEADGVFINTSGIGVIDHGITLGKSLIKEGDKIIITGTIGDHGLAILSKRKGLSFDTDLLSDCTVLNKMLLDVLAKINGVKFMRDPTRGGLATTLNELVIDGRHGIMIYEDKIPVNDRVKGACELLGLDPLFMANEGKAIIVCDGDCSEETVELLKKHQAGKDAAVIGEITAGFTGKVCLRTVYGMTRIVDMLAGEHLPRIC